MAIGSLQSNFCHSVESFTYSISALCSSSLELVQQFSIYILQIKRRLVSWSSDIQSGFQISDLPDCFDSRRALSAVHLVQFAKIEFSSHLGAKQIAAPLSSDWTCVRADDIRHRTINWPSTGPLPATLHIYGNCKEFAVFYFWCLFFSFCIFVGTWPSYSESQRLWDKQLSLASLVVSLQTFSLRPHCKAYNALQ